MKIDTEFVLGLHQNVTAAQGRAAVDQMRAQEALDKARDTFQQAIGGLAVLDAVMGRLNAAEPETEAAPEAKPIFGGDMAAYTGVRVVDETGTPVHHEWTEDDLTQPGEDLADAPMPENLA